jgi:hypothetical protein
VLIRRRFSAESRYLLSLRNLADENLSLCALVLGAAGVGSTKLSGSPAIRAEL